MDGTLPAWFAANELFQHNGNWYFGSMSGLHVGPYRDQSTAKSKSLEAVRRLRATRNEGVRLRYVRELLRKEWDQILSQQPGDATVLNEEIDLTPPAIQVRRGEETKTWYRSSRSFNIDGTWFIATREGIDVGPFNSEAEAKKHELRLISLLSKTKTPEEAYRTVYEYKHRPATDAL